VKDEEATGVTNAASEEHIAKLEGELKEAADQEAGTAQRLDRVHKRKSTLDQQLHEAREQATRLMHEEASQTRAAVVAEAEEFLQAARVEAEAEADRVTKHASDKADEMIAIARREAVAIVDAGRDEVRALEDDAARRMADLDTEHRKLTHRLGVMETICDELRATLKLVAEVSIEQLVETQASVKQPDGLETQQPTIEPNGDEITSGLPPQDSSPTDVDALSALAGDEPASAKIRPQEGARRIIDAALATTSRPVTGESILEAARREADQMTQDAPAETERGMEQPQANVTSSHDAAGDSLVVDLSHDGGAHETEDGGAQHRWWQRPNRIRG
jgi:cell division septum initiation protein DivIVA